MRPFIFQLSLVLFPAITFGQGDFSFNQITSLNGLSHNTVFNITQDSDGFMWFGTRDGLNRFDGEHVFNFYADGIDSSGLLANKISYLFPNKEGGVYIGTNIGLNYYDKHQGKISTLLSDESKSLGRINKVYQASSNAIFICTPQGLFMQPTLDERPFAVISNIGIRDMVEFRKDVFWLLSPHSILMVNSFGETIKEYREINGDANTKISLAHNASCLFKSDDGTIWLGTIKDGLFKYNPEMDWFESILSEHEYNPLEVNMVRALEEDADSNIWIGTESGLFIYNRYDNSLLAYRQSFDDTPGLNDKAIYSLYRSKENIMWVGTYFGGVNAMRQKEEGFRVLGPNGGEVALSGKAVSDITRDRDGKFWIATEDGGVNIWDRKINSIEYLRSIPNNQNSLRVNNVHALHEDADGVMWIGTFLGGLHRYDPSTKKMRVYEEKNTNISLYGKMVYSILRDSEGVLWVGSQDGLSVFDEKENKLIEYKPAVFKGKFIYEIFEDSNNDLWFCINMEDIIIRLDRKKKITQKYSYQNTTKQNRNLSGTVCAHEDTKGRLWFGSVDEGLLLLNKEKRSFTSFSVQKGLPNNYVYGILEDDQGDLWLSTNKGLSEFDPEEYTFKNYDISHGIPQNQFNFKSSYKDESGWMYFGTINGLCYFHPDSLEINQSPPVLYFSDFKLFNESVKIEQGGILKKSINSVEHITLGYSQNVWTLDYASINYLTTGGNTYAYYLDGFENDWNYVGKQRSATYTNLSPGEYTFKLKAANNDGVWSEVKSVNFTVLPPWWRTYWAVFAYMILMGAIILIYRSFLIVRNKERMAFQIEKLEREKITEINRHKINFFTYISHEFKTPLTIIIASIDKFLKKAKDDSESSDFQSIKRNAKRLLFLIDQLMEFRRIEADHAKVNYCQGDIILYLKDTLEAFAPLFALKNIESKFTSERSQYFAYFDSDKLDKIITNLLSNAVKYTYEGEIEMEVSITEGDTQDQLQVILSDTGHGVAPEEINKIFAAFYQTEDGQLIPSGTGLGLTLVKSLIDFLGGKIDVKSNLQRGIFITVDLPLPRQIKEKAIFVKGNKSLDISYEIVSEEKSANAKAPDSVGDFELLIVEDNEEILRFLVEHFANEYRVHFATNGRQALSMLEKKIPDVIISDVLMPEMDGLTLCRNVKSKVSTSHIPVILLSARTTIDNKLEGLDAGADMYLTKPFNLSEIDLYIRNTVNFRERTRKHFLQFAAVPDIDIPINNRDQDLIKRLTAIVEEHIADSNFDITTFCKEAGVSRSLLHLKLKKLVGLSASEFVRVIRLRHAAYLLEKSELNISEIAYNVGYLDPNYFTRTFKEKHNLSPSEYRASAKGSAVESVIGEQK